MPNTVPNQRVVAIHREHASSDFLGIKNEHWQAAARDLGAHALMLYLDKGYLVQRGSSNTYDFYETPQRETRLHNENTPVGLDFTAAVQKQTQAVQNGTPEDIEININNTNIKNTGVEKQVSPPPSEFYF